MGKLGEYITEYSEKNINNEYRPVAVGKYGIRSRESIYKKELAADYSKNKVIFKNTLTVGMGSKQIDIGILSDDEIFSVSPAYRTYKISGVNSKYLGFCLQAKNKEMFESYVKQSARQGKTIDFKRWLDFEIPVPNEDTQAQIVESLESIKSLITCQEEKLTLLNELVKARFVEMFGDPIINNKNLPKVRGEEFFKLSNGKFVPEAKRCESGIPVYGGNGISWYTEDSLVNSDTIVVGRVGFQSGNVHYANGPLWVSDNAMYVSNYDANKYDLRFLCHLMEHIDFTQHQDSGDLKKVTQKPFMSMEYICPALTKQQKYVAFVYQLDKSKFVESLHLAKRKNGQYNKIGFLEVNTWDM